MKKKLKWIDQRKGEEKKIGRGRGGEKGGKEEKGEKGGERGKKKKRERKGGRKEEERERERRKKGGRKGETNQNGLQQREKNECCRVYHLQNQGILNQSFGIDFLSSFVVCVGEG